MKVSRLGCVLVWVAISFLSLTSCSDDDQDEPEEPLPREDVLRNAKDVVDGQIRLPKVIL